MNQKERQHEPIQPPSSAATPPGAGDSLEQCRAVSRRVSAIGREKIEAAVNPATSDAYNQAARQINGQ